MGHRAGVDPDDRHPEARWPDTVHAARRFIADGIVGSSAVEEPPARGDAFSQAEEPPVLLSPQPIESGPFRAITVSRGEALTSTGFGGFLDGIQEVRVVNQWEGIPIIWATIAAAVRTRINRRLGTWQRMGPLVERRYYLPFRYLPGMRAELANHPRVVDTAREDAAGNVPSRHPAALLERAILSVQRDRELIERDLIERWCETEETGLYVDGSITASAVASRCSLAVGVIKSHRTLYADGDAFRVVTGLKPGQRTSVFAVSPRSRERVASWYVKTRNSSGHGALFGLVRVEAADGDDIVSRADQITRWILAEGAPVALPDARWDRMTYGIRDTEEFLRAIC